MTGLIACTIVARNFIPFARVLSRSFTLHNPGVSFAVLVVDADVATRSELAEPFELVLPEDLGLARIEVHRLAAMYGPRELSTALKPRLLAHLLDRHEAVLYLDPDMDVYASLESVGELALRHGIVLTPHVLGPIPRDGHSPTDVELALTGIYNLGFITVGQQARPFLDWWWERLRRDCIFDRREGLFVDQKWVDWVPVLFDHAVIKEPEWNVAHWNIHERAVAIFDSIYTVNGRPLRLFHFSGYRPDRREVLTTYTYRLPLRFAALSASLPLTQLCNSYGESLIAHEYERYRAVPYAYDRTADGTEIDDTTRLAYRAALIESDARQVAMPPDPFDAGSAEAFDRWRVSARRRTSRVMRIRGLPGAILRSARLR